jgi:hypothetical protein
MWFFNINTKRRQKKELTRLNNIKDFDVSESGNLAVLSADLEGQSDVFLISLRRNSIKRLTNDSFDDVNPKFIPGSSAIIFSSNRTTDTLRIRQTMEIENMSNIYNLFIYSIDTTQNVLYRVTNTLSRNLNPTPVSKTEFYYLSDQQGIFNLYKFDINRRIYTQVSKFRSSIMDYDIAPNKGGLTYTMLNDRSTNIYYSPNYNLNENTFTPQTRRQELISAKYVAERLRDRKQALKDSITFARVTLQFGDTEKKDAQDTVSAPAAKPTPDKPVQKSDEFIDTDNYVFDREVVEETKSQESFLSQYRKFRKESEIMGPFDYETVFSANNIVTSFIIDPLLGFGIELETQMNDLLENHKFFGGLLATTDLRSGKLFGEYQYLKYTLDFKARYERQGLYRSTETGSQKYTLNKFTLGTSLPLSTTARISFNPFYQVTQYNELDPLVLISPPVTVETSNTVHYGGFNTEFVFDRTTVTGLNMIEGTRGKISFTLNQSLNRPERSFNNFFIDFRNYQKIHREFVFASRIYYGRFLVKTNPGICWEESITGFLIKQKSPA